jgi:hypothetical protein
MDKSKVAKIKYKNADQKEIVANKGYAMQPLLRKG